MRIRLTAPAAAAASAPARTLGVVAILAVLAVLAAWSPAAASPRVRGASIKETRILQDLLARSETARALVADIDATDLIVYVQLAIDQGPGRGATRLVDARGDYRYLRIVIGAMTHPADRGALIAHELQHALEIGRATDVRDNETLRRLYARIGEDARALFAFETAAARRVGARVSQELRSSTGGAGSRIGADLNGSPISSELNGSRISADLSRSGT